MILHIVSPKYQLPVTSVRIDGGKQMIVTIRSPMARLTINMFVIVLICELDMTTKTTSMFPKIPTTKIIKAISMRMTS